jgi:uncharacterized protein
MKPSGVVLILCFAPLPVYAQSFNCQRARAADEIMICQDRRLSALDEQMSGRYGQIRNGLPGPERHALEAAQADWLRKRQQCGGDGACIAAAYRERIRELSQQAFQEQPRSAPQEQVLPTGTVWRMREGLCGEWLSRWNVTETQQGFWAGTIEHAHVGGPCVAATGQRVRTNVHAVISGNAFFAARQGEGGNVCSYSGQLQGDRVQGVELCEGTPTRLNFALRLRGGGPDQPLEHSPAPEPQLQENPHPAPIPAPQEPPPGVNFEFRIGPGG